MINRYVCSLDFLYVSTEVFSFLLSAVLILIMRWPYNKNSIFSIDLKYVDDSEYV